MDTISPFQHVTTSPSQGEIENVTRVHSTISPSQEDIASVTSERRVYSINRFNELTIQSKINDSEEDNAEIDQNRNPKVATYTTNVNYPQKIFNNRFIPKIIPRSICTIDQTIT